MVLHADSMLVTGTSTNEEGRFTLQAAPGRYKLQASFIGMKTVYRPIDIVGETTTDTIFMDIDPQQAEKVTVTVQFIEHRPNSTTILMQGNPIAGNSTAWDMLYKLPGMYGLSIYGREVSKIFIDGQEVNADIAASMLKSMKASDVESFELIPIADVEYGATTQGSILRIKLHKRKDAGANINLGIFGTMVKQYISPGGFLYALAQWKKVESVTSFEYSNNRSNPTYTQSTYTYNDGTHLNKRNETVAGKNRQNLSVYQSLTYNISKSHSIGGRFSFQWNPLEWNASHTTYSDNTTSLRFPVAEADSSAFFFRAYSAYLFYKWSIDEKGSYLKADCELFSANQNTISETGSRFDNDSTEQWINTTPANQTYFYPHIQLNKSFNNNLRLLAGLKYQHTRGDLNTIEASTISMHNVPVATATSESPYNFKENLYSAYVRLSGGLFGDRLLYQVGANVQHIDTWHNFAGDGTAPEFHSTGIFPSATLQYSINSQKGFFTTLNYSPYTSYPTGYTLTPVQRRLSTYSYYQGNPNLKAPYNHRLQLQQTLWNNLTITLSSTWVVNPIASSYTIGADRQTIYWTPENFGSYNTYRMGAYFNKMLLPWLYINTNGAVWCSHENSPQYGKHTYWNGSIEFLANVYPPKDWEIYAGIGFNGEGRRYNEIVYPNLGGSFAITKSFFQQKPFNPVMPEQCHSHGKPQPHDSRRLLRHKPQKLQYIQYLAICQIHVQRRQKRN